MVRANNVREVQPFSTPCFGSLPPLTHLLRSWHRKTDTTTTTVYALQVFCIMPCSVCLVCLHCCCLGGGGGMRGCITPLTPSITHPMLESKKQPNPALTVGKETKELRFEGAAEAARHGRDASVVGTWGGLTACTTRGSPDRKVHTTYG